MKKLLILMFFGLSFQAESQVNTDSLWGVWENSEVNDSTRFRALHDIAYSVTMSTPDSGIVLATTLLDTAILVKDSYAECTAYNVLGIAYFLKGSYGKAESSFDSMYSLAHEKKYGKAISSSTYLLAITYSSMGELDKALKYIFESIRLDEEAEDKNGLSTSYNQLGEIYWRMGKFEKAFSAASRCLAMKIENEDQQGIAYAQMLLGNILSDQGEILKGLEYYSKSLESLEEIGDVYAALGVINNIGTVYNELADYRRAIDQFKKGIKLLESVDAAHTEASLRNNLASSYLQFDLLDSAKEQYLRVNHLASENDDILNLLSAYSGLANYHDMSGNPDSSLFYDYKNLALTESSGYTYQEIAARLSMAETFFEMGAMDSAFHYGLTSLVMADSISSSLTTIDAQSFLFRYYWSMEKWEKLEAAIIPLMELRIDDISMNLEMLSESSKEKYFSKFAHEFSYLDATALKLSDKDLQIKSYENTLMIKGFLLKSSAAMRNNILSSGDSSLIRNYEDWVSLKRRIAQAYSDGIDTKEFETKANEIEKELVKSSKEFMSMKKTQELTWKDVQTELGDKESSIEFIRFQQYIDYSDESSGENIYCALVVKKDSEHPEMIELFTEKDLENILGTFPGNNLSYIEQLYGTQENVNTQLYDLIWKPMEESLQGIEKVYFSPVGLLHKVSFAALAKEKGVYLSDVHDIEMLSSTGKLASRKEKSSNENQTISVFGGVDYNSDSTTTEIWSYLEGSLTEAEKIKASLKKKEVNYYVAKEASEENFKKMAPSSNILHIATHGFFYADPDAIEAEIEVEEEDEELAFRGGKNGFGVESFVKNKNPLMRSGLALAGANDVWNRSSIEGEDGVLTAAEVATIDMRNTDLVVLSACETGLGDIKGSEGVYGLQRSFKMAGVEHIIMSLWQVPDKETSEFMTTFYKNLTKTNDIKKSFNLTQEVMRKKYDPYFWAAFVLVE